MVWKLWRFVKDIVAYTFTMYCTYECISKNVRIYQNLRIHTMIVLHSLKRYVKYIICWADKYYSSNFQIIILFPNRNIFRGNPLTFLVIFCLYLLNTVYSRVMFPYVDHDSIKFPEI